MTAKSDDLLYSLYDHGFDSSREDRDAPGYAVVRCTQCEATVINGIACHEHGCPNQRHECKGCSNRVERLGQYCEDCQ